jgi:hypothetical protein
VELGERERNGSTIRVIERNDRPRPPVRNLNSCLVEVHNLVCTHQTLDLPDEFRQRQVQAGVATPGVLRSNHVVIGNDRRPIAKAPAGKPGQTTPCAQYLDRRPDGKPRLSRALR